MPAREYHEPIIESDAMTSRSLMHGRVSVSPLPTCDPMAAAQPAVKRLMLQKGELAQIYNSAEPIRMIAYTELVSGKARGNHYHRHKHEWFYLIRGSCHLVVAEPDGTVTEETVIVAGDLVSIATGVAHVIVPLESGHAIEFSPAEFDPADTLVQTLR